MRICSVVPANVERAADKNNKNQFKYRAPSRRLLHSGLNFARPIHVIFPKPKQSVFPSARWLSNTNSVCSVTRTPRLVPSVSKKPVSDYFTLLFRPFRHDTLLLPPYVAVAAVATPCCCQHHHRSPQWSCNRRHHRACSCVVTGPAGRIGLPATGTAFGRPDHRFHSPAHLD